MLEETFLNHYIQKTEANVKPKEININNIPINKLNNNEKDKLEGNITEYECRLALEAMENNKSPGSDRISVEFYKMFWGNIKQYFINSINYSFKTGNLTEFQKQGIITILPKTGKDLHTIENWRPISLLNVDYKIATQSIANRIKKILPNIINENQTGFIKK